MDTTPNQGEDELYLLRNIVAIVSGQSTDTLQGLDATGLYKLWNASIYHA